MTPSRSPEDARAADVTLHLTPHHERKQKAASVAGGGSGPQPLDSVGAAGTWGARRWLEPCPLLLHGCPGAAEAALPRPLPQVETTRCRERSGSSSSQHLSHSWCLGALPEHGPQWSLLS